MNNRHLAVCIIALAALSAAGNEVAPPPLTRKGLMGTWEACGNHMWYWYRMEIFPGGGYLVYQTAPNNQALYELEYSDIIKQKLTLRFRNITSNSSLPEAMLMNGVGYALSDKDGALHLDVTECVVNLREKTHVDFTKGTPTREVAKMFKDAERMIRDAKRDRR
jgi:hypothetical protein